MKLPTFQRAVLAFTVAGSVHAQERNIRFRHLTLENGLSQSFVNCIYQDRRGFMWFGTEDGLNRYDGQSFTVFKHDPEKPDSISHDWIWTIQEDRRGALWIGTDGGGLNRLRPDQESFDHFVNAPGDETSLSHDGVRVVLEDKDGVLWIGTDGGGLNRFDPVTELFTRFNHNPGNPASLANDQIRALHQDKTGALWVGTYVGGLDKFDPATRRFVHYRHAPKKPSSLSDDQIVTVHETRDGTLWVGTYEAGVNQFDRATGTFKRYQADPSDPGSLSSNVVRSIFEDSTGTLWIGTEGGLNEWKSKTKSFAHYRASATDRWSLSTDLVSAIYQDRGGVVWVGTKGGGLSRWNPLTGSFPHFKADPLASTRLSNNVVSSFYEDRDGTLWIGTYGGGLNRFDRARGTYRTYLNDPGDKTSLSDDRVMSLLVDRQGVLWVGTMSGGLNRFDRDRRTFARFQQSKDPRSLSYNGVSGLYEDRDGTLWIGTFGGGLNRFDRTNETFIHYRHDPGNPTSLPSDRVTAFCQDASGILWIGTDGGGLARFDRVAGTFTSYHDLPTDHQGLTSDTVFSIYEDRSGVLWIGTRGGGLNRWDPLDRAAHRGIFRSYREPEGLPNDAVYGILGDDRGSLWLSTNKGLSKFTPATASFKNYDVTHGLQSNEFNFGAYYESPRGELFFGGINGFNAFFPGAIRENAHVPPVVLTSFMKLNQKVALSRPIWDTAQIELTHRDYVVSFEFAALDFTAPEKNRYAYKLEGFEDDWIELGALRRATYTNLDSGSYVFRVRASNGDGAWNRDGVSVRVHVIPPPWKTWWAYGFYTLVLVGLALAWGRAQARKLEREEEYSRKLAQQVDERTRELAERNAELQLANQKLEDASLTDSLTGLRNRRYLMTHIQDDLALVERRYADRAAFPERSHANPDFLFLMIDLDGFKEVNDVYGHAAGDRALLEMRAILERACRQSDTIIRWGGDEFLVVGREVDRLAAERMAERIREAVGQQEFDLGEGHGVRLACSIGFAFYPFIPSSPTLIKAEQVVTIADRALYVAKTSGRNAWVGIFSTPRASLEDVLSVINKQNDLGTLEGKVEIQSSIVPSTLVPDRQGVVAADRSPILG